jgi:hypothetical protein
MEQYDAVKSAQSITTAPPDAEPIDQAARVAAIRARLPGQVLRERLDTARLLYGPLYLPAEIRQRVAETLPPRLGLVRGARLEPIETFGERIPDEALLKYDEALGRRLFGRFWVAVPTYNRQQQIDPWILGEIAGTELCAVIAQWDV